MGANYERDLEDLEGEHHPMHLIADPADTAFPTCDATTGCITCGDVALPLTVRLLDEDRGLALCADDDGNSETVEVALVAPVAVGDRLLVHAGTAIARLTEEAS